MLFKKVWSPGRISIHDSGTIAETLTDVNSPETG
jgi:hypothetical protein